MKESYKKFVSYSLWILIILFGIRCYISITDISSYLKDNAWNMLIYDTFGFAGESIAITTIIMALFNSFFWKWGWVSKLVDMPVLAKEYKGVIVSDWQGKNKQYEGVLDIKQSFLNVSIVFKTMESRSFSTLSSIENVGNRKKLVYIYQNEPKAELTDVNDIHKGTTELWIDESGELVGNYYTNRRTKGSMIFKPVNSSN